MSSEENRALYVQHDLNEPVLLDEAVAVGRGISAGAWWCPGYFPGETHGPHVEDAAERTVAIVGAGPEAEANARLIIAAPRLQRQVVALYAEIDDLREKLRGLEAAASRPEAEARPPRAHAISCLLCADTCGPYCRCGCHLPDASIP